MGLGRTVDLSPSQAQAHENQSGQCILPYQSYAVIESFMFLKNSSRIFLRFNRRSTAAVPLSRLADPLELGWWNCPHPPQGMITDIDFPLSSLTVLE